ncbi:MAG: twin-arginine translocase subunit TatC [Weeksellaceae bacterium]|nr:twin-arginine translocase subunit TatC [Weeksellaceae bacterium]
MPNRNSKGEMPFLEHVGVLRKHLIRIILGIVAGMIIAGVGWSWIIKVIMAPLHSDFITFRAFNKMGRMVGLEDMFKGPFDIQSELLNWQFGGQFTSMIGVGIVAGIIISLPYIVYELFQFIKPGLTSKEKSYANFLMLFTNLFFLLGVAFSYFMVMPLSVHFMYFFQPFDVSNTWTIASYINVFVQTVLAMGIVFLLPIFVYFLAQIGILTPEFMSKYRKHAFVVVLTLAAFITPADLLSMFVAAIPLVLLYELGIWIVKWVYKNKDKQRLSTTSSTTN